MYLPPEELLYISTDASIEETRVLFSHGGYKEVHFLGDFFPAWGWTHVTNENGEETMRLGQIDQVGCPAQDSGHDNLLCLPIFWLTRWTILQTDVFS